MEAEGRNWVPGEIEAVVSGGVMIYAPPLDHTPCNWTTPGQQYLLLFTFSPSIRKHCSVNWITPRLGIMNVHY